MRVLFTAKPIPKSFRNRLFGSRRRTKKRFLRSSGTLAQQRAANHRCWVVRNIIRWDGILVEPYAPVFQTGKKFYFGLEGGKSLFHLPALGYAGGLKEVEKIKRKVAADMTERQLDKIAEAVAKRLTETFLTKEDLQAALMPLNEKLGRIETEMVPLTAQLGRIEKLVEDMSRTAYKANPRREP